MEKYMDAAQYAVEALKRAGADEAECFVRSNCITESTVDHSDFTLMRTYDSNMLLLSGMKDKKPASVRIARFDKASIDEAATACAAGMATSAEDESRAVAAPTVKPTFKKGPIECDSDALLARMSEYIDYHDVKHHEELNEYVVNHIRSRYVYRNSLGADLSADQGYYQIGGSSSGVVAEDLSRPFSELCDMDEPYDISLRKAEVKPLGGKFTGTLIYTPRFVRHEWWLAMFVLFNESAMLGEDGCKRNRWVSKLGEMVASPCFTFGNYPKDERLSGAPFFTAEGFVLENTDFIKDGRLVNLPAARRVSRKLNQSVSVPPCDFECDDDLIHCNFVIKPGEKSIRDIIKGVERGIIVSGMPGCASGEPDKGDINSVIRGGLLIEDGVVTRPVSEVMVAGNFFDKYANIRGISSEYRAAGGDITPWIAFDGFTMQ